MCSTLPTSNVIRTGCSNVIRTGYFNVIRTGYPNDGRTGYPKGRRMEYPKGIRTEELWITEILHDDSYLSCTQVAALLEGHR